MRGDAPEQRLRARQRVAALVCEAERQTLATEAIRAALDDRVIAAHRIVRDMAIEYQQVLSVLRAISRERRIATARRMADDYLRTIGATNEGD